jgi:hypothetical protein
MEREDGFFKALLMVLLAGFLIGAVLELWSIPDGREIHTWEDTFQ